MVNVNPQLTNHEKAQLTIQALEKRKKERIKKNKEHEMDIDYYKKDRARKYARYK